MRNILTVTLAAAGLLVASQVSFAAALAPSLGSQKALESSQIIPVRHSGGVGGGISHGAMTMGPSVGMSHGPMIGHGMMEHGMMGRGIMGHGEMHARHFRHGRFGIEPFYGFGLDYGYPDWYGGGESCYWNCRSEGNGPRFCRANASEYCY